MSLLEVKSFISSIKPFDCLSNKELEDICNHLDIIYFKNNIEVLNPQKKVEFLYFIIKGVIQEKDEDEVISVHSENEFFDPFILIKNDIKNTYITVQETICYILPKDIFLKYMYENEEIESYFFSTISQKLNNSVKYQKSKALLSFAVARVEDAFIQKPIYVNEGETIHNTVIRLIENKVESMLVERSDGEIGIVTDSDLVKKAIYNRMDLDSPVSVIATYGLETINANDFLFNAQLIMSKKKLKRLLVLKDEKILGTLDVVSLNSYFASHTYSTSRLIDNAVSVGELKDASSRFIKTIRILNEKGIKVKYISKLVSQLNEKLFEKLFELTAPSELQKNSCLIIMGSEGRSEQILRTDQDNALILHDDIKMTRDEILEYTKSFTQYLLSFGFPLCDGNIMVSNPFWVKTKMQFKDTIFDWITKPSEDGFMNLAIFYDSLSVTGDSKLLNEIKEYVHYMSGRISLQDKEKIIQCLDEECALLKSPSDEYTDQHASRLKSLFNIQMEVEDINPYFKALAVYKQGRPVDKRLEEEKRLHNVKQEMMRIYFNQIDEGLQEARNILKDSVSCQQKCNIS